MNLIIHSEGLVFEFKESKFNIEESGILKVYSVVNEEIVVVAAFKSWESARMKDCAVVNVIQVPMEAK